MDVSAQVPRSSGEEGEGLLKTSFAYCIILPFVLAKILILITYNISNPKVKKNCCAS